MPKITWSENLHIGISDMDSQHLKLVNLVNELDDAMNGGRQTDVIAKILTALVNYTQIHFAAEERLLQAHGFPEFKSHHDEHEKLTVKLLEVRSKLHAGRIVLTPPVMAFVDDWLVKHICSMDKEYREFLKAKGVC